MTGLYALRNAALLAEVANTRPGRFLRVAAQPEGIAIRGLQGAPGEVLAEFTRKVMWEEVDAARFDVLAHAIDKVEQVLNQAVPITVHDLDEWAANLTALAEHRIANQCPLADFLDEANRIVIEVFGTAWDARAVGVVGTAKGYEIVVGQYAGEVRN